MIRRLLLPLLAAMTLQAGDDISVRAAFTSQKVGLEDVVEFTITLQGASKSVSPPDIPSGDFKVYGGPFTSQSVSMVNFQVSRSITFTWRLNPLREGTLTMPSLTIMVGKQTYRTDPVSIEAVKGSVAGRQSRPNDRFDQFFGRRRRGSPELTKEDVRMRVRPSRRTLYVGDQVTITYELLTSVRVTGISTETPPAYERFWSESVKLPSNPEAARVTIDGVQMIAYKIRQDVLFPTSAGTRILPPVTFKIGAVTDSGGFFGFSQTTELIRKTPSLRLNVKPLPAQGRPAIYSGAVGRFRISAEAGKSELKAGDAVALKVSVRGRGNIRTLEAPRFEPPPDSKVYDPKSSEEVKVKAGGVEGRRDWEWVIVPRSAGDLALGPVEYSYFDPVAEAYKILRTESISLHVAPGDTSIMATDAAPGGKEVTRLGRDIHYIVSDGSGLMRRRKPIYQSGFYLLLVLLPFMGNIGLLIYRKQAKSRRSKAGALRKKRAKGRATGVLKRARREIGKDGNRASVELLRTAMTGYLADKTGHSPEGLTITRIGELLHAAGADSKTTGRFIGLIEKCDAVLFAGREVSNESVLGMIDSGAHLLKELEALW